MLGSFSYNKYMTAADYNYLFRDFFVNRLDLEKDSLYVNLPLVGKEKRYKVSELMDVAFYVIESYLAGNIDKSNDFSYVAYRNGLLKKETLKTIKGYEKEVSLDSQINEDSDKKAITIEQKISSNNPLIEDIYANNDELIYNLRKLKDLNRTYVMTEHMINLETVLKMSIIGLEPAQRKLQELLSLPDMNEIRELIGEILSFPGINLIEIL